MEKSMMLILRWLYSSRGHSSQFQFGTKQQFGCMILYQTWLYDDFVYIYIFIYSHPRIHHWLPQALYDHRYFRFHLLAFSFRCPRSKLSQLRQREAICKLERKKLQVYRPHRVAETSRDKKFATDWVFQVIYIFCEGTRKAHTFRQKTLWGKLGKL